MHADHPIIRSSDGQDGPAPKYAERPVILVFSDFYLPGYKSGGGMRTLVNIVERFGDEYDFRIVTRDHDGKTDRSPYPNISYDSWAQVGKASVRYLAKDRIRLSEVRSICKEIRPDCIFLNSYFSTLTIFVLILRKFGGLGKVPVVIAPQGELSDGGLELKRAKKVAFLRFASSLHLYRDIVWRTTSQLEADELQRAKGDGGKVFIAPDLPPRSIFPNFDPGLRREKKSGSLRLVFLSRLHPKKNPIFLIELLSEIKGTVDLDLVGPIDASDEYVARCRELIAALPQNISVNESGGVKHEEILETLIRHDFFVLPTLAENFGHVFLEALSAGCPLIISDRTPWAGLEEKGIGWDIPLEDRQKWIDVINKCVDMDATSHRRMTENARRFAEDWIAGGDVETANRDVFEYALSSKAKVDNANRG